MIQQKYGKNWNKRSLRLVLLSFSLSLFQSNIDLGSRLIQFLSTWDGRFWGPLCRGDGHFVGHFNGRFWSMGRLFFWPQWWLLLVNVMVAFWLARYGGGFHRSRKMLGHDGEWFGLQGDLFYHLVLKRKKFPFKIFFKSTKCVISDTFCQISWMAKAHLNSL